jgi:hypothetical protein
MQFQRELNPGLGVTLTQPQPQEVPAAAATDLNTATLGLHPEYVRAAMQGTVAALNEIIGQSGLDRAIKFVAGRGGALSPDQIVDCFRGNLEPLIRNLMKL